MAKLRRVGCVSYYVTKQYQKQEDTGDEDYYYLFFLFGGGGGASEIIWIGFGLFPNNRNWIRIISK